MRINCHTHTFNLKAVFTPATVEILLRRLADWKYPGWLLAAVQKRLEQYIETAGEYTDPETIAREILGAIISRDEYQTLLEDLSPTDRVQLEGITVDGLEDLASQTLGSLINRIGKAVTMTDSDARHQNLIDLFEFVFIGVQPSIRRVTDIVMPQLGTGEEAAALVALTLDVTKGGDDDKDRWQTQLHDTSQTVLAYPGRILPFVCVNTRRDKHFATMEHALVSQGFVGVKLYPSLGYKVDSPEMKKVFAYCAERAVPILTHCNEGGFYRTKPEIDNSDPALWIAILAKFPELKVCFGQFGGGGNLITPEIAPDSWTDTILKLMIDHPNVYADIAGHTDPMDGGSAEDYYFANLKQFLADPATRNRILFGSDFFLVRQRLQEKSYWQYFESRLTKAEFKRIAEQNPRRYLGLPVGNGKASWALQNYARFLWGNRTKLTLASPAVWLAPVVTDLFGADAKLPQPDLSYRWDAANRLHAHVYKALKSQLSGKPKFAKHGNTPMLKLAYWRKGLEAPSIWTNRVQNMAHKLDAYLLNNKFAHRPKLTSAKAVKELSAAFDDQTTTMWQLAALCGTLYRSTKEVE